MEKVTGADNKSAFISFRIDQVLRAIYEGRANERGQSLTDFMKEGLEVWATFDNGFIKMVREYSADLKVLPGLLIENMVIRRIVEIRNAPPGTLLDEFIFNSDGVITGPSLIQTMEAKEKDRVRREIILGYKQQDEPVDEYERGFNAGQEYERSLRGET